MIDCYKLNGDGGDQLEDHHLASTTPISLRGAKRVEPPVSSPWKGIKNDQMPPPCSHRITLQDLRAKLSKLLGPRREREYCSVFSSFITRRLSKSELDRRLTQTLGRDNICLHNQIVQAILSTSLASHSPPPDTCSQTYLKRKPEVDRFGDEDHQLDGAKRFKTGEDVQDVDIQPPLGLPFCVQSIGAAARLAPSSGGLRWPRLQRLEEEESEEEDELPDTDSLRKRMQRLVEEAGLEGLSQESAVVLGHALDRYLKRMIDASIQLKRMKTLRQSSGEASRSVSLADLRSAMELRPQQMGENWPSLLEKLTAATFEREHVCIENQL